MEEENSYMCGFRYSIIFLPCRNLKEMHAFYNGVLGLPLVLDQGDCLIFSIGAHKKKPQGYWGFCNSMKSMADPEKVCLTLVVSSRKEVDQWHRKLTKQGVKCRKIPSHKPQFHIYNAFFQDPMNYTLEIQTFDVGYAPK